MNAQTIHRFHPLAAWLPAALAASGGIAMQHCILLATAGLLGVGALEQRLERSEAHSSLRAALVCIGGGIALLAYAAALLVMVALVQAGVLGPIGHPALALGVFVVAVGTSRPWGPAIRVGAPAGLVAFTFAATGSPMLACVFSAAVAFGIAWVGWQSMGRDASDLIRAGSRHV